jgi:CBS domain containing-hemolysin-like protein
MVVILSALIAAILVSAFLSAAELSIFMLSEARVRALAEQGPRGAVALASLRARPERTLVLLRLLDATADVCAGVFTVYLGFQYFLDPAGTTSIGDVLLYTRDPDFLLPLALLVAAVSLVAVYVGELLPLGIAANHGVRLSLAIAPIVLFATRILSPFLLAIARLANIRSDRRETTATITETGIRQLNVLGHNEGEIEEHERELIDRAFRLNDTKTWEIMTPRVDVFAWRDSLKLADIASEFGTVLYSRVPVYGENIDDITGVLYVRDAYQALLRGQRDVQLRSLAREPLIVPGSLPLTKLLRDFQNRRIHMAVVVDEYGGTDGVVTLEDVIEELVGEIVDETDETEELIVRVSRNEIIAVGESDLREINHIFNTALPQLEHRSLNGFLLEELGHVPAAGERLEREGVVIEVLEATDTQVTRARLRRVGGSDAARLPQPGAYGATDRDIIADDDNTADDATASGSRDHAV